MIARWSPSFNISVLYYANERYCAALSAELVEACSLVRNLTREAIK